jgi:hypothetical protein
MGGAVATPLPPVTAEALNHLTQAMYRLLEEQKETNRLLRKEIEPPSEWLSQDEVAEMLGQTVKPSGQHRKILKRYRDNGWLTIFASCNPYRYSRKEVEKLADDFINDRKYPLAR